MERQIADEIAQIIERLKMEKSLRERSLRDISAEDGRKVCDMVEDISNIDQAVQLLRYAVTTLEASGI